MSVTLRKQRDIGLDKADIHRTTVFVGKKGGSISAVIKYTPLREEPATIKNYAKKTIYKFSQPTKAKGLFGRVSKRTKESLKFGIVAIALIAIGVFALFLGAPIAAGVGIGLGVLFAISAIHHSVSKKE